MADAQLHFTPLMKYIFLVVVGSLGVVFFLSRPGTSVQSPSATSSASLVKKTYENPPPLAIDTKKTYKAIVKTTKGVFTISLLSEEAPQTVNNFIFLAKENFYDGVSFHRIIEGFMIQAGDPNGDGTGGPGYTFADEPIRREYTRGIVAMANRGPDTNGSQFFIMHADNKALPKQYVIFGEIERGIEVIDAIATVPTKESKSGEKSTPTKPVIIEDITIEEGK